MLTAKWQQNNWSSYFPQKTKSGSQDTDYPYWIGLISVPNCESQCFPQPTSCKSTVEGMPAMDSLTEKSTEGVREVWERKFILRLTLSISVIYAGWKVDVWKLKYFHTSNFWRGKILCGTHGRNLMGLIHGSALTAPSRIANPGVVDPDFPSISMGSVIQWDFGIFIKILHEERKGLFVMSTVCM